MEDPVMVIPAATVPTPTPAPENPAVPRASRLVPTLVMAAIDPALATVAIVPVGGNRPGPGPRPPGGGRPPQWGRPPQNRPSYNFRPNDRSYLRRYYLRNLGYINRANRPRFLVGGFFPYAYISYLTPLPPQLFGYLPPPPPGYAMGYYDGYVVVYDPVSYFIANVVDLMDN